MPFYHKLGNIPKKRHVQFRQPDGSLYAEQLVGTLGFSGVSSLLYHINPPTVIDRIAEPEPFSYKKAPDSHKLAPAHLQTLQQKTTGTDYLNARKTMLFNNDLAISICNPSEHEMSYYYKNGMSDEVVFVHEGSGELLSQMGKIEIHPGDYVVIPRTIIHKFRFNDGPVRLLIVESHSPIETPRRYRNHFGQLLEHSPFCERDMRPPTELITEKEPGDYLVKT
ncbi:MAG: homogentisate 1,2-dioxygenase, partial [Hymenobacteraceae bacterium]|nr:homogentisate 1,2-dioxygenase [Hymenobacteraceae bacterium]